MFEALGDNAEGEGLHAGDGFVTVAAIREDARQDRDFREPTTVDFAFDFYREGHWRQSSTRHGIRQLDGRRAANGR
jgi:hypothetical protein